MSVARIAFLVLAFAVFETLVFIPYPHRQAVCRGGASSIGPVTIVGGKVTGSTTPHLTGCRP